MFLLAVIVDKLKTHPDEFDRDPTEVNMSSIFLRPVHLSHMHVLANVNLLFHQVLLDQIDIKFSNKVILEVGLCISLFDFQEIGDPYVYPAEGSAHQRVKFRMVVFRPFAGEVNLISDSINCFS